MMSPAQINYESQRAARKAAREHKKPFLFEEEDREHLLKKANIPNIGDYRPEGWELTETLLVDSSGFGQPGEPALTIGQFIGALKPGMGYAIIEAGQFQVVVGEFKKI